MKKYYSVEERNKEKKERRDKEVKLVESGKETARELGERNFFLKGVDLLEHRNDDGSFNLF